MKIFAFKSRCLFFVLQRRLILCFLWFSFLDGILLLRVVSFLVKRREVFLLSLPCCVSFFCVLCAEGIQAAHIAVFLKFNSPKEKKASREACAAIIPCCARDTNNYQLRKRLLLKSKILMKYAFCGPYLRF